MLEVRGSKPRWDTGTQSVGHRLWVVTERVVRDGPQCGVKRLVSVDGIRETGNPLSIQSGLLFLRRLGWAIGLESGVTPYRTHQS
jgi:hypothetical protein